MDRVVKCKNGKCEQHFMHTKKNTKCPFCHTEYGELEAKETDASAPASTAKQEKEETTTTQKGAFKIKIVKNKDN